MNGYRFIAYLLFSTGRKNGCSAMKNIRKERITSRDEPFLTWDKKVPHTRLEHFRKRISEKYNIELNNYWDLHKWSIEHFEQFWEETWNYLGFITSKPHDQVFRKTGEGILDVEWFPGMLFNAAENLLKIKENNRTAIIYLDETGCEESVTYAEMFEEVKLYAAAFRKHGLKKGDIVACYISNRKEAVFIYLAVLSIGAIFGGPQPYFGAQQASNIIQKLKPKFLIAIDHHTDDGVEFHNIESLPKISKDTPSLEKVIIIPTRAETYQMDISNISNSCFLHEFLLSGIGLNGAIPDIQFEQLPFSHPVSINFTSGTTGLPKGPVHCAGSLVSQLLNYVFYWNLKPGDVVFSCYPVGWTLFNIYASCFASGVTLFLFAGSPYHTKNGRNMWDLFARYKVSTAWLITSMVDKLEKLGAKPSPDSNLEHLKSLTIGGSPVKKGNISYLKNNVKEDMFVGSQFGATESFGSFSGIDINLPSYAGELQVPSLGMDIRCVNSRGENVVGERGELVIATPTPSLPIHIFEDYDKSIMKETYLSKYPGFWCQHDEIYINPKTKGLIVIGRSDDTLKQNGERFGAGDVYSAIHDMEEIRDYICVGQTRDSDGEHRAVLFIQMKDGYTFTPEFKKKVEQKIFDELWVDCVPQVILQIPEIPYNLNNKRMESVIRKIAATNEIPKVNNIRNPDSLKHFCNIPEIINFMNYNKE
ncbi:acetoacetyl-CoA synthetase-like isoform X1 [Parasteatoda tepidariorum]|uniref:acetoacetyl-CoA synthetase-like isoform X1 n=2 Tax=Parasteatoda tepidariorum TaxID=114398 RepID=UPI001C724EF4|nr:acetoacetyl-CoA synthetase-like isoform X1 [Parasteatoda tepidariorum]